MQAAGVRPSAASTRRRPAGHLVLLLFVLLACGVVAPAAAPAAAGTQVAAADYGYPYPNAPDCDESPNSTAGCVLDAWRFYQGQCTSWVAYRVSQLNGVAFSNGYGGGLWGDASNWGNAARARQIPVDLNPAVGAIVWYASGHVGYVEEVRGDGSVVMSEMNRDNHNGFSRSVISRSSRWPSGFIHVKDRPSGPPRDGDFVRNSQTGEVFRIAGGAPIYVSSWGPFGGSQPTRDMSPAEIAGLPQVPADNTFVTTLQDGRVYRIAGGAPIYVSTFAVFGGDQPTVGIDQWAVDNTANPAAHLRAYPADGTFISSAPDNRVYRIAGGAPIYVSTWEAFGGSQPSANVDQWAFDHPESPYAHMRATPADGTFINDTTTREVFRIAGSAPVYVSTWDAFGGSQPSTGVDHWALQNRDNPYSRLRTVVADGAFVNDTTTGEVFRVAGGAPIYVSTWRAFGGQQPTTGVDHWALAHRDHPASGLRSSVANGTFVRVVNGTKAGLITRGAGGTLWDLSTCGPLGGCAGAVDQDEAGFDAYRAAHRDAAPGTVLRGLPSGERWAIDGGLRRPAAASAAATDVNDTTIAGVPLDPCPSGPASCPPTASGAEAGSGTAAPAAPIPPGGGPSGTTTAARPRCGLASATVARRGTVIVRCTGVTGRVAIKAVQGRRRVVVSRKLANGRVAASAKALGLRKGPATVTVVQRGVVLGARRVVRR